MAMEVFKLNLDARCRKAQLSLVRRLVQARDDPAKRRIRHWLSDINVERLLAFGLTEEDIALLRGIPEVRPAIVRWLRDRAGINLL